MGVLFNLKRLDGYKIDYTVGIYVLVFIYIEVQE
jgi:hypothetical protein